MLDEFLEIFDRDKRRSAAGGGLRARLARAIGGHDDRSRHLDDDHRRDRDDDEHRSDKRRRRREFELFDDD